MGTYNLYRAAGLSKNLPVVEKPLSSFGKRSIWTDLLKSSCKRSYRSDGGDIGKNLRLRCGIMI